MGPKRKDMITISPMSGGVNHGEKQKCVLTFCPPCRTTLRDSELTLKVGSFDDLRKVYLLFLAITCILNFLCQ